MKSIHLLHDNHHFHPHISYSTGTILASLGFRAIVGCSCSVCRGLEHIEPRIYYGRPDQSSLRTFKDVLVMLPSGFFGSDYLKPASIPAEPLDHITFKGNRVPVLFGVEETPPPDLPLLGLSEGGKFWLGRRMGTVITNLDLISTVFFHITRYEEVVSGNRGSPYPGSTLTGSQLADPVVNRYIQILEGMLGLSSEDSERRVLWPDGRGFAVCLTHDVDQVTWRSALNWYHVQALRESPVKSLGSLSTRLLRGAGMIIHRGSPFWTFRDIMRAESGKGIRSSFFFMASPLHPAGPDYRIKEPRMRELMQDLREGGWEVAIHLSDRDPLGPQIKDFSDVAGIPAGARFHRLSVNVPSTFGEIAEKGLAYDCSLGHNDQPGFRAGFCHPFIMFDAIRGQGIPLLELPLAVMDSTFYWLRKMDVSQAERQIDRLLDVVESHGGLLVILWHNTFFDSLFFADWRKLYLRILDRAHARRAFIGTARDIADWWIARLREMGAGTWASLPRLERDTGLSQGEGHQ